MKRFHPIGCRIGAWRTENWEQALEECAQIGFQGIECTASNYDLLQDRIEAVQEALKRHTLSLIGIEYPAEVRNPGCKQQILQNARSYFTILNRLQSNLLLLTTGRRDILQDKKLDFTHVTAVISELGKLCLDHDCYLCVMAQYNTRIMDEEDIDRLMNRVDIREVFLGVDTAHLHRAGCTPEHIVNTFGECLKHVRLQDAYPEGDEPEEDTPYAVLGKGCISFRPVLRALDQVHYAEGLTLALDTSGDPAAQFEESYHTLQEWIKTKDDPEPIDPFTHGGLTFR